jgi:hypothetical protein
MFTHAAPAVSHRCHWRENEVGVGDHVPFETRSSSPTAAVPLSTGLTEFVGPDFASTTSLGSDGAPVLPSALPAVTTTRTAWPTSPVTSVYVFSVAPVMSPQPAPALLQRCHWYVNVVGLPDQVPFDAVSVEPSRAVPLIVGAAVFVGAAFERAPAAAASDRLTSKADTDARAHHAAVRFLDRCVIVWLLPLSGIGFIQTSYPLQRIKTGFRLVLTKALRTADSPLANCGLSRAAAPRWRR